MDLKIYIWFKLALAQAQSDSALVAGPKVNWVWDPSVNESNNCFIYSFIFRGVNIIIHLCYVFQFWDISIMK